MDVEELEGSSGGLKHEDEEEGDDGEPEVVAPVRKQPHISNNQKTLIILHINQHRKTYSMFDK